MPLATAHQAGYCMKETEEHQATGTMQYNQSVVQFWTFVGTWHIHKPIGNKDRTAAAVDCFSPSIIDTAHQQCSSCNAITASSSTYDTDAHANEIASTAEAYAPMKWWYIHQRQQCVT